ncbi:T-cell surface glycoprotein CD8 alpha chain isoform 2-T2 [Macrochelys suwanniensis]
MSVRLHSGGRPLTLAAPVELECVISGHGLSDSGVSWMRQNRDSAPEFILFITSLGRVASTENGKPPARFKAKKESNYRLTVTSFQEQDQGNYYCIVNHNQRLHFSSGIPLYLPAPPTAAPTTKATTPPPSTTARSKDPGDCKHSPKTAKAPKKGMDLSCDFYIWVPLASACLLLLIALLATITVCQKTRRRRCKCKRPMNGSNGKPSMPNRYV